MVFLLPVIAGLLPFFVWPVERFLPYPYIVEELAKTALVLLIPRQTPKSSKIRVVFVCGLFFALSEAVMYLFNIIPGGGEKTMLLRLALTIPLHIVTFLAILLPSLNKRVYLGFGLFLAILLHYCYNSYIAQVMIP